MTHLWSSVGVGGRISLFLQRDVEVDSAEHFVGDSEPCLTTKNGGGADLV